MRADTVASRNRIIAIITAKHPDAQTLISSKLFLDWVKTHDPAAASFLQNVVKKPWKHDPQLAIDIIDSYKETVKPRGPTKWMYVREPAK